MTYIVIGAGILGASTAYHLAKQGANVTLVDRNDPGQATEAAAGIVCPWLTNRANQSWYHLVKAGAKYYPSLIRELEAEGETETGYSQVGAINIFSGEDRLQKKYELALERQKSTPEMGNVTKLSATETKALFPPLSDRYGAVHISGAARVNGAAMRNALIRGAKRHGTTFIEGEASLLFEGNTITGVKVNETDLYADKVLVTGGTWSKELLEPLGMQFQVKEQKAQIVHLQLPDTDTSQWPVVMAPYSQYLLGFEDGKVVVGATQESNAGRDLRVTAGSVNHIIEKALNVAPGLESSTYVETKVGFRPFTPGSLPVIGPVPNVSGLLVANGLGASGLTSGPYLGAQLALVALGKSTEITLQDFDVAGAFEQ
ncbi:NAD(P)/FAD-dependent oxidoreductase [Pontibacillus yanchengensis]|uniref:Oxidoreductase n=1 Tax=Pontibacillus yanchengensis Y32 TaxID=1385514 RepID=A0A0A2TCA4_9BACI|nr:FAD-dependent oxidoreductase [Pontibacillus yanchengensis]KGP71706.1 oxidoreductase [Pontibacillus yanchengensis Y32]